MSTLFIHDEPTYINNIIPYYFNKPKINKYIYISIIILQIYGDLYTSNPGLMNVKNILFFYNVYTI